MIDFIIIGIIIILVVLDIIYMKKQRDNGKVGCGCSCEGCNASTCGIKNKILDKKSR